MTSKKRAQAVPNTTKQPSFARRMFASPWTKSVFLHALILLSLLVSFNFSAKPLLISSEFSPPAARTEPQIVQASFIDSNVIEQRKRDKAQAAAAAQKKREQDLRKERLRKKRAEEERKRKEQEKQRAEQARIDKLKQEQLKEQAIREKREKEEQQKRMQQELEREMQEQLEREKQQLAQQNSRRVMSEVEKYMALVQSKIKRNLTTGSGFVGKSCFVNVRLANDGLVLQAQAKSGDPALCRLAEAAVIKAETLPVSKDPEVLAKFKQFTIEVRL